MKIKQVLIWLSLSLALALSINCAGGEKQPASETPTTTAGPTYQPTGDEGTITGKVSFQGEAPKGRPLTMDADPVCAAKHSGPVFSEKVVANDNGTLRHVFVYVKAESAGLQGKTFAVPSEAVELDQDGCLYKPHVLGLVARQNLKILNSDATTHNIHPSPQVNREWNEAQQAGADPLMKTFTRSEVMIPVKCNQHPWMLAYIGVLDHPFFAVTDEQGNFEIKGLPPGDYEIETYHEAYQALPAQTVTIGAKESKTVDFSYAAQQARRDGSLKVLPAMVLPCCGGHSK